MKLPQYAICGMRPVKAIQPPEGGMDILVYQWDTGEFKRDLTYLKIFAYLEDEDVEFVDYPEFERRVKAFQAELRKENAEKAQKKGPSILQRMGQFFKK